MFKNQLKFQLKGILKKSILSIIPIIAFILFSNYSKAQSKIFDVKSFDKVVVSPHIQVIFKEGDSESVTVESITVPMEKLNVVVEKNTLNVFLEDARIITKNKKDEYDYRNLFMTTLL